MFDHDLLRTFVAIVDAGSFSAAAELVGRTPSAVSMQIKRLEEAAGRRLFSRGVQGVQLTGDGEVLLVHARDILNAHEAAIEAMMSQRGEQSLTLGMPDAYVRSVLVTEYQLADDDRGELVHMERGLWMCADECPALASTPLPVALTMEGSRFRRLVQEVLRAMRRPYRIAITTNAETVIHAALCSGSVIGALPECRLSPGLRELTVADGFPPLPPLKVRMRVGRRRPPPAGEWLVERLVSRARGLGLEPPPVAALARR